MTSSGKHEISRVSRHDAHEYFSSSRNGPPRPVLITDVVPDWPAFRSWTPDALGRRLGDRLVTVDLSPESRFHANRELVRTEQMPFAEYLRRIAEPSRGERLYLQQQDLPTQFPELLEEVRTPEFIPPDLLDAVNLWFGPAGNVSPLHYDSKHNLFAQVCGTKRMILFPPADFWRLYPHGLDSTCPHASRVNPESPDVGAFPEFVHATRLDVTVGAGDLLFIPAFFWHEVASVELGMSVNFWWKAPLADALTPAVLRALPYVGNPLRQMKDMFDVRGCAGPVGPARLALATGHPAAALVFARSGIENALLPLAGIDPHEDIALEASVLLERTRGALPSAAVETFTRFLPLAEAAGAHLRERPEEPFVCDADPSAMLDEVEGALATAGSRAGG